MDSLPRRIDPCPIIEAVIEIRFSSNVPPDAVFGVIYAQVKEDFDTAVKKLPILQIPEVVRTQDPALVYLPHYSLSKPGTPLHFNIGPRAITFSNSNGYVGWETYFSFVKDILIKLEGTEVLAIPERVSIRYINFFDYQILDKINLSIMLDNNPIVENSTNFRTEFHENGYVNILQIFNNISTEINGQNKSGSIIDIDCVYNYSGSAKIGINEYMQYIGNGHEMEKRIFFSLLKSDFLGSLQLEY